ncbi:hypothetical protein HK100_002038, partial [Physocladia obscura]
MALTKSEKSPIVRAAKIYEMTFGKFADGHLCVTKAMKNHLQKVWKIQGNCVVLYDRAPSHFRRLSLPEIHEFLCRLIIKPPLIFDYSDSSPPFPSTTILTTQLTADSPAAYISKRPALIVSSTSWTPDEDFSILLAALVEYEKLASNRHANLIVVVTGKGPQKSLYEKQILELDLTR